MNLSVEKWYPAIFKRKSRRNFSVTIPELGKIARLEKTCREFRPFPEARAELVKRSPHEIFKGIIGRYGKVTGAPYYLAFIGQMSSPRVQESVGYVGEALILEATAIGLDTCWVGGLFRPGLVETHVSLGDGEKVLSVTPIGHAQDFNNFTERSFKRFARSAKRKSLKQLIIQDNVIPPWASKALEAARLAPSAANRQPWRFQLDDESITVSLDSQKDATAISKRLDCGIAMLHLELGALAANVAGTWEHLENPLVARFLVKSSSQFSNKSI
jgi:nitroreductase